MMKPKRIKHGGRIAGTPNKVTASVKAAIEDAFDNLGGVPALVAWAQEEPGEFYKLWAKLLPTEIKAEVQPAEGLAERLAAARARRQELAKVIVVERLLPTEV